MANYQLPFTGQELVAKLAEIDNKQPSGNYALAEELNQLSNELNELKVRPGVSSWNDLTDKPFYDNGTDIKKLDNKFLDLAWLPTTDALWVTFIDGTVTLKWGGVTVPDELNDLELTDIFSATIDNVVYEQSNIYNDSTYGNERIAECLDSTKTGLIVVQNLDTNKMYISILKNGSSDNVGDSCVLKLERFRVNYNKIPTEFLPKPKQRKTYNINIDLQDGVYDYDVQSILDTLAEEGIVFASLYELSGEVIKFTYISNSNEYDFWFWGKGCLYYGTGYINGGAPTVTGFSLTRLDLKGNTGTLFSLCIDDSDKKPKLVLWNNEFAEQNITLAFHVDTVRYGSQTLTDEEKAQARLNIGCASLDALNQLSTEVIELKAMLSNGV